MTKNQIRCKVEHLIACFDVMRHCHKNCLPRLHHLFYYKGKIEILHSCEPTEQAAVLVMTTRKIHGVFVEESQRAALRERFTDLLKGVL
jgi:hypothetical protein